MAANGVLSLSLLFLITLSTTLTTNAVDYSVTNTAPNTAGSTRFNNEIGADYVKKTLANATDFVWNIFQESTPADRKNVDKVSLFIDDFEGVAYSISNGIHVSANFIGNFSGDIKEEITGILFHEMTHIWMWNGEGEAPAGLIEGISDYVRMKSGHVPIGYWVKAGGGNRWDQGYDVTATFLDYIDGLKKGFVAELNRKMKSGYSDSYFMDLTGKSVGQLWREYKAKYGNSNRRF